MPNFGLTPAEKQFLIDTFSKYEEVKEVLIYGSRAKDTYHERSDVDLVINSSITDRFIISKIKSEIDESNFPYLIDLTSINRIKNPDLLAHIQRVGKKLL